MEQLLNFSQALEAMKQGLAVSRKAWGEQWTATNPYVCIQEPDEHSKMTKSYIYMIAGAEVFPLTMTQTSVLAEDWFVVDGV